MVRERIPQQQELITDVWTISKIREDVERLLEHIVRLQADTIALAGAYGAKQSELAIVAGLSRQRIGQLYEHDDVRSLNKAALEAQIYQVEEWPQHVMMALSELARPRDVDDTEYRDRLRRQTAVVYGQEEADRRHERRSAFLVRLDSDPAEQALIQESAAQARRRVFGEESA